MLFRWVEDCVLPWQGRAEGGESLMLLLLLLTKPRTSETRIL